MTRKPLLCLDVDGVCHSYTSGWLGADRIPDPPVPGAMEAIQAYVGTFRVAIFSSRTGQPGGVQAMQRWFRHHLLRELGAEGSRVLELLEWPTEKPPALVTIDNRAVTFTGRWPTVESLAAFQPWNKRDAAADRKAAHDALSRVVHDLIGVSIDDEGADALATDLARLGYRIVRA